MALLPVLFAVATLLSAHYLDEHRQSGIGDVLSNWYFIAVIGFVVIVPVLVVSLCGAAALTRWFRLGRLLSTVGCTTALLATAALTYAGVTEALSGGIRQQDPNSWTPSLSAFETLVFTAPFAVIAGANLWVLVHLWARAPSAQGDKA
ncbi:MULTISPECIES: hypothetical protein [Rhodococcus]|uniref:hypothetical protein n=1 Tax=Rhodococcus TaxID=1827 RepID=UPI0011C078DE|nr:MULTISPECIES: hypothetical protein [Rhodococcus]QXU56716.1 hypothetical protein KXC42_26235 [Rhodococcus sp. LW-XY12]